jgi:4-amino-4-deoxy-L-arabinose transferase-like glycosyltransferase
MLAVIILSANIVFAWESTTAYIDIGRSFFEILALWGFLKWIEQRHTKLLITTGVFLGLAITTKILAISSLIIFLILCIGVQITKKNYKKIIKNCLILIGISFAIPLPWFIFSFIHTGDPVFPFFTQIYQVKPAIQTGNIFKIIIDFWNMMLYSSDPISPIYLIMLPCIFLVFSHMNRMVKIICLYSGIAILFWLATPRTGGGRFILPYLPALSIAAAAIIDRLKEQKGLYNSLIVIVSVIALSTCLYRGIAEKKYIPVLTGKETKATFLAKNLNFEFGDFYDIDGYLKNHIKTSDKVLLYGFHNLYYIDFPFIDSSWVKKGDEFDYIGLQNAEIPKRFANWKLIYENKRTHLKLYTKDRKLWIY